MVGEIGTEGVAEMVAAGLAALPARASKPCDGCWNQVRPGGADPRAANISTSTRTDGTHIDQHSIGASSGSRMQARIT